MKAITIAGNLGRDAEVRRTQNGDAVTSFSVGVKDRIPKEKATIWFLCTIWGKRGETLAAYLTKGAKVVVSGELSTEAYEGKTNLTVRVEQVTLMGGGQQEPRRDPARQAPDYRPDIGSSSDPRLDDEIPF